MNKSGKIAFVRELAQDIADTVAANISNDKVPDQWDGYELKEYFLMKANEWCAHGGKPNHDRHKRWLSDISNLSL